jgi:N-acetylglucosamine-6-sulfatase
MVVVLRVALFLATLCAFAPAAEPSPNIVLVIVDDLRWDDLGCAGHPFAQTPNIDRVAREGARFTNAFITTPLCSPSRASILTGQYAHSHGIIDNTDRSAASHTLATFPQGLQKAGYETAFFGKWHMGNDNTRRPGFDRWFALAGQGTSFDSVVNDEGKTLQTKGYVTDVLNSKSVEYVRQRHEKPFLLYLSHKAIHPETAQAADGKLSDPTASNFIPAPRHRELFSKATIPRRPNWGVPPTDKPALMQSIEGLPPLGRETGSSDTSILNRLRMLAAVDEGVGDLLAALKETGQLDNTLFCVIGDHGYFYGEHGLSVERRLAYEESIRIPMLMRLPRLINAGSTPDGIALALDLAPTFVELAGGKPSAGFQGRSLLPLLQGSTPMDWRTSFLVEYYSDTVFPRMKQTGYRAVRMGNWKYIRYTDQVGMDELYDLKSDPYELQNRINDPALQVQLRSLQAELDRLWSQTGGQPPSDSKRH